MWAVREAGEGCAEGGRLVVGVFVVMADEKRDELESQLDSLLSEVMSGGGGAPKTSGDSGVAEGDAALKAASEEAVRDGDAGGAAGGEQEPAEQASEKMDNASLADQLEMLLNDTAPVEEPAAEAVEAVEASEVAEIDMNGVVDDASPDPMEGMEEEEAGVEAAAAEPEDDGPADMSFIDAALAADAQDSIEAEVEGALSDESVGAGDAYEEETAAAAVEEPGKGGGERVSLTAEALESSLDDLIRDSISGGGKQSPVAEAAESATGGDAESVVGDSVEEGLGAIEAITEKDDEETEAEVAEEVEAEAEVTAEADAEAGGADEEEESKEAGEDEELAGGFEAPEEMAEEDDFDDIPDELEGGFEAPELEEELVAAQAGGEGSGAEEVEGGVEADAAEEEGQVVVAGGRWDWVTKLIDYLDRPLANREELVRNAVGFAALELVAGGVWLLAYAAMGGGMVSMIVAVMLGTALLVQFYRVFLAKKGGVVEDIDGAAAGEAAGGG